MLPSGNWLLMDGLLNFSAIGIILAYNVAILKSHEVGGLDIPLGQTKSNLQYRRQQMITWISGCWGVSSHSNGYGKRPVYCVMFGDNDCAAVSGIHRTARRAKKEITHYISQGFRAAYHGAKRRTK